MKTRERRMITGRVETRALTDKEKSAGYIGALTGVIPFNTDSVTLRDRRLNNGQSFVERIAPKAFDGSVDVMGMAGHTDDPLAAFARQGANLTLAENEQELRWDALLPNTTAARDLFELGEKRIIIGTSFEFESGAEDKWEKRDDGMQVRTVTRGRLLAVNPVVWPAYDDSALSVSMRSRLARGFYAGAETYDATLTADARFAMAALASELEEFGDAQDYLRANPAGALVEYAQGCVSDCAEEIQALLEFLVKNGATVNPEMLTRAAEAAKEKREKISTAAPAKISADPWETGLRIFTR